MAIPKTTLGKKPLFSLQKQKKWTESQNIRAGIVFQEYPDLEVAYNLSDKLRKIYNQNITKSVAMLKLAHWFKDVEESGFKSFSILKNTITNHYNDILNYFDEREYKCVHRKFQCENKELQNATSRRERQSIFLFRLSNFCLVPNFLILIHYKIF